MKKARLIFLFCCSISLHLFAQQDTLNYSAYLSSNGLAAVESVYNERSARALVKLWDRLYPAQKVNLYTYLSAYRWEKILEFNRMQAKNSGNEKLYRQLSFALAIIYHRQTQYAKSTPLFVEVTKFKQELSLQKLKEAYLRLETSYRASGQFNQAIKIRRIRIRYGFINNFWELYSASGLYKEAIQDFKLFEKMPVDDDFEKVRYLNKLGNLYLDDKQADKAIYYFNKMKEQADFIIKNANYKGKNGYAESVKVYYRAIALANIAEGHILKGHYLYAIPKLEQAVAQCKKIEEVDQKIVKWLDLAQCYLKLKQASNAKAYLDSSKTAMVGKRMFPNELKLLQLYAQCNRQLGNKKAYLVDMISYLKLKDSVLTVNQVNQSILLLANMDAQQQKLLLAHNQKELQVSKRDQTYQQKVIFYTISGILALIIITGLLVYNIIIQIKNRKKTIRQNNQLLKNEIEISKQNAEKEILLKEVHHRVKNNLNVIYSLLNLQKRRVGTPAVQQNLVALQSRIKSMALVHQQLYAEGNLKEINLDRYIKNLVLHLNTIFDEEGQEIELIYEIENAFLPLEKVIPVGLIINEAVSNAFKYAFVNQKQGCLKISFQLKGDTYQLEIADNGVGFTSQQIAASSLGLQLIKNMADQLNAGYHFNSEKGTTHLLSFKI